MQHLEASGAVRHIYIYIIRRLKFNEVLVKEDAKSNAAAAPDNLDTVTRWRYIFARTP